MIDILLTTYNGEKYIAEQLDSLINQDYRQWRLIVRDDGSADSTVSILECYRARYPDNVVIISDDEGNVGIVQSFSFLMVESSAEYVAFCDQDDIWQPEKLSKQLSVIEHAEKKYGINTPILIQSNLCVVNDRLEVLSDSFWTYQNLDPSLMNDLQVLLLHNYVTGCACFINKKLCDLASPLPDEIIMHDWWLGLVALTSGQIILMEERLVLYRQHESNQVGASRWGWSMLVKSMTLAYIENIRNGFHKKKRQGECLLEFGQINKKDKLLILQFINLFDRSWLTRRVMLIKSGFHMFGVLRNFLMFILI